MADTLSKASSVYEIGTLGLNHSNGVILEEDRDVFIFPESMNTYQKMSHDPIITSANNIIDLMVARVKWKIMTKDDASLKAKKATEFLNYCMNNLDGDNTWRSTIDEIGSYRIYGFHVAEKVFSKVKDGKWKGKLKWSKLATRAQTTIAKWIFDDMSRELVRITQETKYIYSGIYSTTKPLPPEIEIPRNKFLLFTYGKKRGNPTGQSPLMGAYIPWRSKALLEEYELISVAKNMIGVPVMGIDANFLAKAQSDTTSSEALVLAEIQTALADLHAGEQTYMILPIAYTENGKELFTFKLIGIEGSGSNKNNVDEIIKRKQQEILMNYLADVLKLGSDSVGSFSLAESKTNLLSYAIDHHLQLIADVINHDLIPQTLALNGWELSSEEMPYLSYTDLESVDLDSLSKFIQRVGAVVMLPNTPQLLNEFYEKAKLDFRMDETADPTSDDYMKLFPKYQSRSGDGMESGMSNGTGDSSTGGDDTAGNGENIA